MDSRNDVALGEVKKQKPLVMKNMRMKSGAARGEGETEKEGSSSKNLVNINRVLLSGILVVLIVIAGLLLIYSLNKSSDNSIDTQAVQQVRLYCLPEDVLRALNYSQNLNFRQFGYG